MKLIHAKGAVFKQGAIGPFAKREESPVLENDFSADYWMDSVEVSQAAFRNAMKWEPVSATSEYGYGGDIPVYRVSWYDAILFCNARSRMHGLDTVYEYSGLSRNGTGGVYAMAGLTTHLERTGFRLPTEAEWEFAAKAGSNSDFPWGEIGDSSLAEAYAWHSGNSGDRCHAVGGLKANAFGIFDMAGNVMEWVNDWKGPYPENGATDFAGSRDPGTAFEKPVKGGAFKYGLTELRPANRSATYATIPSAAAEYVGFRCVLGAIPAPRFVSPDGKMAGTDPFALKVTRLKAPLSGRTVKLVFVNASASNRNLVYLDYRSSPPKTREFTDFNKVFHPAISPDGRWVAFGTGLEGSEEPSEIFIRGLDNLAEEPRKVGAGFIPRWWVDSARQDTSLLFTSTAVDNQNSRWGVTRTLCQKISGGNAEGAASVLTGDGGFHDGRSQDGRYLASGFRLLKMRDLGSGSTSILFSAPENGKTVGDTSQVCNVSMAPDASGNTLFLDFGFAGVSRLIGSAYGIHQYAFIAGPDGKVSRWFRSPADEAAWSDLEWSNHPDYAITAATNAAGEQKNIYLLNLRDSVYTALVGGSTLIQPGLWVGGEDIRPSEYLNLDSLGRYDEPATYHGQTVLAYKMHFFWRFHEETEAFFLGSSQMADGLDPRQLTSVKGLNLAFGGGAMKSVDMLIRNYILPHAPKTRLIAISVPFGWFNTPDADGTWIRIHPGNTGFMYDSTHDFWKGGLPTDFGAVMASVPYPALGLDSLGLFAFPSQGWGLAIPLEVPGIEWDVSSEIYKSNMKAFENRLTELSNLGIHCLFMTFPQSPRFVGMNSYSSQGPSWTTARAIAKDMEALAARYPFFHFLDLNKDGNHGYLEEDAFDDNHLSEVGASKLSKALDAEIQAILAQ